MRFATPLVPARLIRRYKRFLADVTLPDGTETTAHCANPGSMLGLAEPGMRIWLEPNDDPRKKLKFGWRLVEHATGHFTGVDTGAANRVVAEALVAGQIPGLHYPTIRAEVPYGDRSRVDFLLRGPGQPHCYVEVKSITLSRHPGLAEFPDCVTARGARQLNDLSTMVVQGHRAVMLYLIQRTDCTAMTLAADLDPAYAAAFAKGRATGVEALCYDTVITPQAITLGHSRPLL